MSDRADRRINAARIRLLIGIAILVTIFIVGAQMIGREVSVQALADPSFWRLPGFVFLLVAFVLFCCIAAGEGWFGKARKPLQSLVGAGIGVAVVFMYGGDTAYPITVAVVGGAVLGYFGEYLNLF